jgi:hypothetical protein
MKLLSLICFLFISVTPAQQAIPHGMVYGHKPSRTGLILATNLEKYMGKRTRISASVSGRVTLVTKSKGGWFDVDAGGGRIITAHFKDYTVTIPKSLKNRYIIMDGVAQKKMIADDSQHYAGGSDSRQHTMKANPLQLLMFEVRGLMVTK